MKKTYDQIREERKDETFTLKITTHVPEKWRMVDLETGDVWEWRVGDEAGWRRGSAHEVVRVLS